MEKVGLYIVDTLHALTQKGLKVQFTTNSPGMLTVVYSDGSSRYHREDLGTPGGSCLQLEKAIIKSLSDFLQKSESY
jgi:hypothetical protein